MKRFLKTYDFALLALICCCLFMSTKILAKPQEQKVYELRVYHVHEGKLADLHARFRNHTHQIFERLNMKVVAYWTPTKAPDSHNTLVYIMEHPSEKVAKQRWKTFVADPEWQKAFKASRKEGPLVKSIDVTFMRETDFNNISQLKAQ